VAGDASVLAAAINISSMQSLPLRDYVTRRATASLLPEAIAFGKAGRIWRTVCEFVGSGRFPTTIA